MSSRIKNPISLTTWIIICFLIIRIASLASHWTHHGTLTFDVIGFYVYLPAVFIYDDLETLSFVQDSFIDVYKKPVSGYASFLPDGSGAVAKTPMGMAILYLPFFLMAHFFSQVSTLYPADGFSMPYQIAVAFGSMLYAWLGLWGLRKILLRYFKDVVVALTLATIVLGSNYLNYVTMGGAMAHGHLFNLYVLLIWVTLKWHEKPKLGYALAIGGVIGFISLVRPTDFICILIPIFWGITSKETFLKKISLLWQYRIHVLALSGALMLAAMPQLIYWKIYSGDWLYYSYDKQGFDFLHPHIWKGLFSWHKGWFVYSPMMVFPILGFFALFRQYRSFFWPLFIFTLVNIYVVFSWEAWDYGGGFGARPLVQSYAVLAFPMAAFLTWVMSKSVLRWVVFAIMFLLIDLNLLMTWQCHGAKTGIVTQNMTKAYYWRIFGRANTEPMDKIFLDVDDELKDLRGMKVRELHFNSFETDSLPGASRQSAQEGKQSFELNTKHPFAPGFVAKVVDLNLKPGSWIRPSIHILWKNHGFLRFEQTQLVTSFEVPGKKALDRTGARMQHVTSIHRWNSFVYEVKVPENLPKETILKVYAWNPWKKHSVFIDNFKVEAIEPE